VGRAKERNYLGWRENASEKKENKIRK